MVGREKVIKGLECCMVGDNPDNTCAACPYNYDGEGGEDPCLRERLMPDAIALLKAQEAEIKRLKMFDEDRII